MQVAGPEPPPSLPILCADGQKSFGPPRLSSQWLVARIYGRSEPDAATRKRATAKLRKAAQPKQHASVHVSGMDDLDIDSALNVELAAPRSHLQQAIIEAILHE